MKNKNFQKPVKPIQPAKEISKDEKVILQGEIIEEGQKGKDVIFEVSSKTLSIFSGPLPPPEDLKLYNNCYPNAAEIIFKTFEKQVDHRISLEKQVINTNSRNSTLGLIAGFIIGVLGIGGGIWLLSMDKNISGFVSLVGSLAAITTAFIVGKSKTSSDIKEKKNDSNIKKKN